MSPETVSINLREASIEDAQQIAVLVTELGYPTSADEMKTRLQTMLPDTAYAGFVAEQGDILLGFAGVSLCRNFEKAAPYARMISLIVADAGRSHGIGGQLVDRIEQWAIQKGARELMMNSASHRHQAHRFYEQRGFQQTGIRFVKQLDRRKTPSG